LLLKSFPQTGNFYLKNFTPSNYMSTDQNRGFVQDSVGRLFVANLSGVLVYDGFYWEIAMLKNESAATSINKDKTGKIYVGGQQEFGQINQTSRGDFIYQSISEKLPQKDFNFSEVWSTISINDKLNFCSNEKIIQYDGKNFINFEAPTDSLFHTFFSVANHLFIRQFNVGFKVLINGKLNFVEGSEIFSQNKVRFILPKYRNEFWVGTEKGMYIMFLNPKFPNKSRFQKVICALDNWMIEKQVYCGLQLSSNKYAIGSQQDGIVITDGNFNLLKSVNSKNGLQDDFVTSLFEDNSGNLWLSLNKGISYLEINSPITKWTKFDGIKGTIESSCKFKNQLFIGTDKGLLFLNEKEKRFETTELHQQVWDICSVKSSLLIATSDGVILYDGKTFMPLIEGYTTYKINVDQFDDSKVYLGGNGFYAIAKFENDGFSITNEFETEGETRYILQNKNQLFFGVNQKGIDVLNTDDNSIKKYGLKDGLRSLQDNCLFLFKDKVMIGSGNGILSYNENKKTVFNRDENLNPFHITYQIAKPCVVNNEIFFQGTGPKDNITKVDEISSLVFKENKFITNATYLKRIKDVNAKHFFHIDSSVYISTNDGLFCYDLSFIDKPLHYKAFISSLILKNDTVKKNLFGNCKYETSINYQNNQLNFNLSATNFIDKSELEFAYYLEGLDTAFGKWSKNNEVTLNQLHEGNYVFHAKVRDVIGNESEEVILTFKILPPWYRSVFAYAFYIIALIGSVALIIKYNTQRLRNENIKLEAIISERTKTIVHQKAEIELKNKEITDSINYAKGIQYAILPTYDEIKQACENLFIFYQPKDIVSGDFYWFKQLNEDEFLIACADCTGHGVPGGFMSMICSDKLHDAVRENAEPAHILYATNNGVKTTLKQEIILEGKSKDGMEISLIKINKKTKQISYSGANRPLWIIDGETLELTEIKPTKASVASFTEFNFEYEQHNIQLKTGDLIYATTDGFPDQFGGEEGKKYMSKKMKNFILSIAKKPIAEQRELLNTEINQWMKNHEQVDDLLVIGIRL
jgi:serine phosphatase RsbU (regulator of sigma subunit)/ligand-binding sensor domain-containing protein